jgi:hypothetical protein
MYSTHTHQRLTHTCIYRMVMVRHNRKGDVMVLVQYSSNNCSRADLDAALAKLKTFFLEQNDKVHTQTDINTPTQTHTFFLEQMDAVHT